MIKEGFFPTLIYAQDFKLDTNQMAQNIIQWSKEDGGVIKTNVNGWHSKTHMHTKPEYKPKIIPNKKKIPQRGYVILSSGH